MFVHHAASSKTPSLLPEFRVDHRREGGFLLHVVGKLPLDWVSNLTGGLARHNFNITRAEISNRGAMTWHGHFSLLPGAGSISPANLDFVQMVRSTGSAALLPTISIDRFDLQIVTRHGGTLYLEIAGQDQLGFLGALLKKLAFFSLFPLHMEIETASSRILDRFWLSGPGGTLPAGETIAVLRDSLRRMIQGGT